MPNETHLYNDTEAKQRLVALLGEEAIGTLESSHVLVVGIGGVGGACAEALVRGRIGTLSIIDGDEVESSNINRQAVAFVSTVGQRKTDAFISLAHNINPQVEIHPHDTYLTCDNIENVLDEIGPVDYICDCMDSMSQKIKLAKWAQNHNIPLVSAMGAAKHYDPTSFKFADIYQTSICPVAKKIRKAAKKEGIDHLCVLYSDEQPRLNPAYPDMLGSLSYMPPIMGEMIAGKTICDLLGISW